jgi:hypothetical protein
MFDIYNTLKEQQVLAPVAITDNTARVGTVVDLVGFDALKYSIAIGTLADADATFAVLVEDSDDNVTYAAVADDFLLGTEAEASFTFADDNEQRSIGYNGSKRYNRITITPANNTGSAVFGVTAILGYPLNAPTTNNA